ncbi:hypothetical protein EXT48_08165 [Pseudoalteromonas sp. CO348]|uniref:hypothetical protein n=1 Tax=Pseudoalteromonas sp. CO348 TaxID=1777271 RepID=UPI001023D66B|nr:hypothetical protein [Pseudoalteromonas sp. CO348]RZG05500.1 hypothetical protein EXT48_08165 [Pseudoalteromonas sp. CO348]
MTIVAYETLNNEPLDSPEAPCYKLTIGDNNNVLSRVLYHPVPRDNRPTITLESIELESSASRKIGDIWWVPLGEPITITAQALGLPNGGLMVMVERVVNASQPIEDLRFIATIKDGVVTLPLQFDTSGNYLITAKRLNEGLARIENAPFRLDFETMEFDVYVPVATA